MSHLPTENDPIRVPGKVERSTDRVMVVGIIAGVVLVTAVLAAIVGLELAGRDPQSVLYLLSAVLVPTGVGVFNTVMTGRISRKVDRVEAQTNGTVTRLLDATGIPRSDRAPDA